MKDVLINNLGSASTVAIFGHVRPDGDCTGSTLALYNYIRLNYKHIKVAVYLEQPPEKFAYLHGYNDIKNSFDKEVSFDLAIALDCADRDRLGEFIKLFENAKKTICIDHHVTNTGYADIVILDENSSSTCEALYELMEDDKLNRDIAECIYTGIIHDTGVFKYSCTSKRTMEIAGRMMEYDINFTDIIDESFYQKTFYQNKLLALALSNAELINEAKLIYSVITIEDMQALSLSNKDMDGIIDQLRNTKDTEVALLLYELDKGLFKISLRSKKHVDVSGICACFGGGGHIRAAGCSIESDAKKIVEMIKQKVMEQIC